MPPPAPLLGARWCLETGCGKAIADALPPRPRRQVRLLGHGEPKLGRGKGCEPHGGHGSLARRRKRWWVGAERRLLRASTAQVRAECATRVGRGRTCCWRRPPPPPSRIRSVALGEPATHGGGTCDNQGRTSTASWDSHRHPTSSHIAPLPTTPKTPRSCLEVHDIIHLVMWRVRKSPRKLESRAVQRTRWRVLASSV